MAPKPKSDGRGKEKMPRSGPVSSSDVDKLCNDLAEVIAVLREFEAFLESHGPLRVDGWTKGISGLKLCRAYRRKLRDAIEKAKE